MDRWNIQKSAELYHIDRWSGGFFRVNNRGEVEVTPRGPNGVSISLKELVDDLEGRGLRAPLLIRFQDIVDRRIQQIFQAFDKAIQENQFKGGYQGLYPIKVNQQRYLVEEIVRFGKDYSLGLEAGSKPELLVALAMMKDSPGLLVCNGFKDRDYIETALLSQKMGRETLIVIDRFSEIEEVLKCAQELNVKARLGFRCKLDSRGSGKWAESSGNRSKFGLDAVEICQGVEVLKRENALDSLELLHFHIGSQVSALRAFKESFTEGARVFVELVKMGANLKYLDIGGGLGVDYDGSQTQSDNSINYSIEEYASDVVYQIMQICDANDVPHPTILSESGRALVAHHSVLVTNVIGKNNLREVEYADRKRKEEHELIGELRSLCQDLCGKNLNESIQDAFKYRDDADSLFKLGYFDLQDRACMESLFRQFCLAAVKLIQNSPREIAEKEQLQRYLHESYFCNFSVFQSMPDAWAVKQLFPIMPIHRLEEEPTNQAVVLDLTCDSDGKIDRFVDPRDDKTYLELHDLKPGESYYLGIFLIGAYQEILGDLHNLFGDTDAVHVSLSKAGYSIEHVVEGDTITEVLEYVQYDRPSLIRSVRSTLEAALKEKTITLPEARLLMRHFEEDLNSYTYLEPPVDERELSAVDALRKLSSKKRMAKESSSQSERRTFSRTPIQQSVDSQEQNQEAGGEKVNTPSRKLQDSPSS